MSVMQLSVEHRRCQGAIAAEGLLPFAETQVRGQDDGAFFVAFGNHLKEEVRLRVTEGQVHHLINSFPHKII